MRRDADRIAGELALARGDRTTAIEALGKVQSALPLHAMPRPLTQHVATWDALARAYLAAGDRANAAEWFRRITESTVERVYYPVEFVRSFYFLGEIAEHAGERDKAREYYRRFLAYWKDGNLDRERVAQAERKIAGE